MSSEFASKTAIKTKIVSTFYESSLSRRIHGRFIIFLNFILALFILSLCPISTISDEDTWAQQKDVLLDRSGIALEKIS